MRTSNAKRGRERNTDWSNIFISSIFCSVNEFRWRKKFSFTKTRSRSCFVCFSLFPLRSCFSHCFTVTLILTQWMIYFNKRMWLRLFCLKHRSRAHTQAFTTHFSAMTRMSYMRTGARHHFHAWNSPNSKHADRKISKMIRYTNELRVLLNLFLFIFSALAFYLYALFELDARFGRH